VTQKGGSGAVVADAMSLVEAQHLQPRETGVGEPQTGLARGQSPNQDNWDRQWPRQWPRQWDRHIPY
jgi:hypothetical protein